MSVEDELEQGFEFDFQHVEDSIAKHTLRAFSDILTDTTETVYCLSLYYTGSSFSYLFPTYNTEQALLKQSKKKSPTDPLNHAQRALRIRWSPCDFAYHADTETLGEEVEKVLAGIEAFAESFSELESDDEYEQYDRFYSAIHARVINALKQVCMQQLIQQRWAGDQIFLVNLFCGDQSNEARIENAIDIGNPEWMIEKYQQQENESYELLSYKMKNRIELPEPTITLDELLPWVDRYQPKIKFNLDMLSVSPHFSLRYRGDDPVEFEAVNNEFRVLDMLSDHPRYAELQQYYQTKGFSGARTGEPLFEFGRALASKLYEQLKEQYPEKKYIVALIGIQPIAITVFRPEGRLPNNIRNARRMADSREEFELLFVQNEADE